MVDNFTLPSDEVLCALINRENQEYGSALTPDMIAFGNPMPSLGNRNTDIRITALDDSDYGDYVDINYDRIPISEFPNPSFPKQTTFTSKGENDLVSLLPRINTRWKINLSSDEIINVPLPDFVGSQTPEVNVELSMVPTSLAYLGSVTLTITRNTSL